LLRIAGLKQDYRIVAGLAGYRVAGLRWD